MAQLITDARVASENSIIATLIVEPDTLGVCSMIRETDFVDATNRMLFVVIKEMADAGLPVDEITLIEPARIHGIKQSQIADRASCFVSRANLTHHIRVIVSARLADGLQEAHKTMSSMMGDVSQNPSAVRLRWIEMLEALARDEEVGGLLPLHQGVVSECEKLMMGEVIDVIPTRLTDIDKLLSGGLRRGELVVLAGRPSMGKTALASQIGLNLARDDARYSCVFFSLEMSFQSVVRRAMATMAKMPMGEITSERMDPKSYDKVYSLASVAKDLKFWVDDSSATGLAEMRAKLKKHVAEGHSVDVVIVDYLQIMKTSSRQGENRERAVAELSMGLKSIAKDFDVAVIALSQLNRGVEQRQDKHPLMSDLRDSGSVEQDADVVMMIYRDEYYNPETLDKGIAEVNVVKNRNGATGTAKIKAILDQARFENLGVV